MQDDKKPFSQIKAKKQHIVKPLSNFGKIWLPYTATAKFKIAQKLDYVMCSKDDIQHFYNKRCNMVLMTQFRPFFLNLTKVSSHKHTVQVYNTAYFTKGQ